MIIDGISAGDGTTVGNCPNSLRCLSSGECRVCKVISGGSNAVTQVNEGCESTHYCVDSTNPPSCGNYHKIFIELF